MAPVKTTGAIIVAAASATVSISLALLSYYLGAHRLCKNVYLPLSKKKKKQKKNKSTGLVDAIGNTPLIRIDSLSRATGCEILGKCEFLNPGGSVKDRVALKIIQEALESGKLSPGGVVTEGSAGSTAISLATVASAFGCKCHVVIPDDAAIEKSQILEVLGATVERVRPVAITHRDHYVNVARRRALEANELASKNRQTDQKDVKNSEQINGIIAEDEKKGTVFSNSCTGGFFADQFENLANFRAHYEGTGPEIWEQTDGILDAFVAAAGTGGTVAGVSKFLQEKNPKVKCFLIDPPGSGLFNKVTRGVMYTREEAEGRRLKNPFDTITEGIGINRLTQNFAMAKLDGAFRLSYVDGPVPVPADDPFLMENVQRIHICDTDEWVKNQDILLFWQVKPVVHVFQLSEEGPCEELGGDGQLSSFNEWILPAKEFDGMWESLIYESGLKQRLLRYAASTLLFTDKGVDPFLVSWNRIILLHGPPGTGKTSLCKALAQKLSIRFNSRYSQCQLVEVNAHSLFSKWFSESGKLVAKLFQKIQDMIEEENNLVFVLIDEVESLAAARKAALSGSEPSDSIRVVNALLTQMDKLKTSPNVIILTTSNITAAIDIAFVDRADIKAYVGPPTLQARYEILRSCLHELIRKGIISNFQDSEQLTIPNFATLKEKLNAPEIQHIDSPLLFCKQLLEAAEACEGLSGRSLRKLPFLAHAALANPYSSDPIKFLQTMIDTARREHSEQLE